MEESKEKNMRLERVKINNLKVSRKLNIHRQIMLRFQDQREYRPNYSVIEKHQPTVKLDSKSTRLFLRHINPVTIPSIKSYNSRNNKNKKNDFKKKVISSLSELKIASNSKNILAKSQQDIIDSNEKEIGKRKVSLSTLNIKPKKFNTLIKDSYTNKKNCFIGYYILTWLGFYSDCIDVAKREKIKRGGRCYERLTISLKHKKKRSTTGYFAFFI